MAENKKSFVLYADIFNVVSKLPKEKAGELFLHILQYVNDMNPETDDLLINIAFEPIKLQLKRDLQKWESSIEQRRQAGIKSAESRHNKSNKIQRPLKSVERESTNSTDNVNVTVTVNDNVIKEEKKICVFSFKKELRNLGVADNVIEDWLKVRKTKKATNSQIAFDAIKKKIDESGMTANQCITIAVEKSWSGFDVKWINNTNNEKNIRNNGRGFEGDSSRGTIESISRQLAEVDEKARTRS